jgi:hypothetical protein
VNSAANSGKTLFTPEKTLFRHRQHTIYQRLAFDFRCGMNSGIFSAANTASSGIAGEIAAEFGR